MTAHRSALPIIHLKVGFFFFWVSALIAGAFLADRAGFPEPIQLTLVALAVTALLNLGPLLIQPYLGVPPRFAGTAHNLLAIALILLIALLSYLPGIALPLLYIGAVATLCLTGFALRGDYSWKGAVAGLVGLLGVTAVLVAVSFSKYHPPTSMEMALHGRLFEDTLIHTTVIQMLKFFGIASIGIDGLVPMRYYAGAHFVFARLSSLAPGEVANAYPLFIHVLLVPQLVRSLASVAIDFANGQGKRLSYLTAVLCPVLLLVMFGSMEWDSYIHSFPYTASLVLLLAVVPLLLYLQSRDAPSPERRDLLLWLCALVIIPLVSYTKISTGFLVGAFASYVFFRSARPAWMKAIFIGATGLLFLLIYHHTEARSGLLHFAPFEHVLKRFVYNGNDVFFIVVNIFTIAYVAIRAGEERIASWPDLRGAIKAKRLVDVEALLLVTALGMSTWTVFGFWSAAYYFDNVQMWIALPLVTGFLLRQGTGFRERASLGRHWGVNTGGAIVVLLLLAPALKAASVYLHMGMVKTLDQAQEVRELDYGERPSRSWLLHPSRFLNPGPHLKSPGREVIETVLDLRRKYGRSIAVYVPTTNSEFWALHDDCWSKSLFIPAMTGVPLLDGLPPTDCPHHIIYKLYQTYGFYDYKRRTSDAVLGTESLCRRALAKGFTWVYSYASISHPEANRLYDCREVLAGR